MNVLIRYIVWINYLGLMDLYIVVVSFPINYDKHYVPCSDFAKSTNFPVDFSN